MRAVRCPVGAEPEVIDIKTFEDLKQAVGTELSPAFVTRFSVGSMWDCWCDEDGLPKRLPENRHVNGMMVVGTFVLTRHDNRMATFGVGEMTEEQAGLLVKMVKGWWGE